jgi:hypothetical protein
MNAMKRLAAWAWLPPQARQRLKRRQLGFVMHEAELLPALPARVVSARARFEHEARQAMREWLML